MFKSKFFNTYLLPGFVFQSITIGGGYGTGRELVEFFMTQGPLGGLFGMFLSMLIWSLVLAVSFELARKSRSYDYRTFIKSLLGNSTSEFFSPKVTAWKINRADNLPAVVTITRPGITGVKARASIATFAPAALSNANETPPPIVM